MRRLLPALLFLILLPAPAEAQRNPARARVLLEKADALLAEGNVRGATVAYERALEADRDLVPAYLALGRLAAAEGDWSAAGGRFNDVLKRDEENVEAHYYRAIVDRELGRFRTPVRLIKERINWRDAERHFEWVLARDSTYRDVLYQYALLEQYRGDWERAFHLAHRQMALRPEAAEPYAGLFRLYTLYVVEHPSEAEAWLRDQSTEIARFFQAEWQRRHGDEARAEAMFRALLADVRTIPRAPIHLALARIHAGENDPEAVEAPFWQAVQSIQSRADALLVFEDVKYILREDERVAFDTLASPEAYQAFFRAVWARRDPMPAAAWNVRLVEHYRRLRYADAHFAHYGPRAQFNNPDRFRELSFNRVFELNREYNDKGFIYLRHGPADEVVVTISNDHDALFTERRLGSVQEPLTVESWRYHATAAHPEMIIHFASLAGGNWRMVPDVGTFRALEDRIEWGPLYNPRVIEPTRQMEMRLQTQASIDAALATDRHRWADSVQALDLRPLVATFRAPEGQTAVEVFYAFPVDRVVEHVGEQPAVTIETGVALHDRAWRVVEEQRRDVRLRLPQPPGSATLGHFGLTAAPDSYHVALHVLPEGTPLVGGQRFDLAVPDYGAGTLQMSDILPASDIRPAGTGRAFARGGWAVTPNPTGAFARAQPIGLFFEVYHLTFDAQDQTRYSIEYTLRSPQRRGLLGRLFGRSRTVLSVESPATGTEASPVEVGQLDVSSLDPGRYTLTITVTDQLTGRQASRSRDLILY